MSNFTYGKQVNPVDFRHRRILGCRKTCPNGVSINLDKGQVLSLCLVSDGKEPTLIHINGDEYLKDAKIRDLELLQTTRQIVCGPTIDTYVVKIKTSKGICRLSYRHEIGGAVFIYCAVR